MTAQDLTGHPGFTPLLMPHDFFLDAYSDWNIVVATDNDLVETHPHNKIRHMHSLSRLLVRAPE